MIRGKKVLEVIPARGGSKGVPGKNIRVVAGKPLIAWTIEEAKKSRFLDRVMLSSDDHTIIKVAREWGAEVPFVRPSELAQDNTPGVDPVLHAIREVPGYDYVVLLQPTSPLRTADDIDGCIEACLSSGVPSCVSVTVPDKSPYWMYTLTSGKRMKPVMAGETYSCRQSLPSVYALNGAVYVAEVKWLEEHKTFLTDETIAFEMPREHSLDIDTELDLRLFEFLKMQSSCD